MEKTKIGIPASWLGAAFFLFCLFGGYTVVLLVAGYIFLAEESKWLKKVAVLGLGIMLAFSLVSSLLYLPNNLIGLLETVVRMFDETFYIPVIDSIYSVISSILSLIQKVLFLILTFLAVKGKTLPIPALDSLLDRYLG